MASLCEQCDTPKNRSRRFAPYHDFFSDILSRYFIGYFADHKNSPSCRTTLRVPSLVSLIIFGNKRSCKFSMTTGGVVKPTKTCPNVILRSERSDLMSFIKIFYINKNLQIYISRKLLSIEILLHADKI